ncbi:MAG: hypothetical protein NC328_02120 [Muribaculum sp.]|nr:hypothetical protein [Muribaculum sp.]
MENYKRIILKFKENSSLPDLLCDDGEIENSERWFTAENSSDTSGENKENKEQLIILPSLLNLNQKGTLPSGAKILGCHSAKGRHDSSLGADKNRYLRFDNLILLLADGAPAYIDLSSGDIHSIPTPSIAFDSQPRITACGEILVFCHGGLPLFSRFKNGTYSQPRPIPSPLRPKFTEEAASLPGYCDIAGDLPQLRLTLPCPAAIEADVSAWLAGTQQNQTDWYSASFVQLRSDIEKTLRSLWDEYLAEAQAAGLAVIQRRGAAAISVDSPDANKREYFAVSAPSIIGSSSSVEFRISSFRVGGGELNITVLASVRPIRVHCRAESDTDREAVMLMSGEMLKADPSHPLQGLMNLAAIEGDNQRRRGWRLSLTATDDYPDEEKYMPVASGVFHNGEVDMTADRVVSNEFVVIDRSRRSLFRAESGISFNGRIIFTGEDGMWISGTGPTLSECTPGQSEGYSIEELAASMKSLSSGQLGDFPLYSFSRDGIRALTPDSDFGFRSVQLICRDSILPGTRVAPTLNGVAMITQRGVVTLEGSRAQSIGMPDKDGLPAELHWHYGSNSLIARYDDNTAFAYSEQLKEWLPIGVSDCLVDAWPVLLSAARGVISEAGTQIYDPNPDADAGVRPPVEHTVYTRPLKLGDRFALKKVKQVALSPDAETAGFEIEGSRDLNHWHLLGRGKYRICDLRGSGWRFFRLRIRMRPLATLLPSSVLVEYLPCSV